MICFCYQDRYASLKETKICCRKSTAAKQKRKQIILKMFEIMFTIIIIYSQIYLKKTIRNLILRMARHCVRVMLKKLY